MGKQDDLGVSLVKTLSSDEIISIASDAVELSIDTALGDGLLKDIPVISSFTSLAKLGFAVRDIFFIKKILRFLRELNKIPSEERRLMVEKLENDPAYGRNAGEHLIEILEKIDTHRKPEMTARVFSAYAAGRIDAKTLHRLNNAIDKLPFYEIDSVRRAHEVLNDDICQALESAGLMRAASAMGGLSYVPNDLCSIFVELDIDKVGTR